MRRDPGAAVALLAALALVALVLRLFTANEPWLGHDYEYFVPRLLETADYLRHQLGIQYWSRFCGGSLAYGNPQTMQFSLLQLLFLGLSPRSAVLAALVLHYAIGWVGCAALLRGVAGRSAAASAGGALLYSANGFSFAHLLVGHLTFLSFAFVPGVLALLFWPGGGRAARSARAAAAALGMAACVYQGSHVPLIVLALSVAGAAVLVGRVPLRELVIAGAGAGLLAASRLVAIGTTLARFPHDYELRHANELLPALGAAASLVWAPPGSGALGALAGQLPWWELTAFVSPVALLAYGVWLSRPARSLFSRRAAAFALLLAAVALLAGAWAPLVRLHHELPLLRSVYVVTRYAGVLVLPAAVAYAFALDRLPARAARWLPPALAVLIVASFYLAFQPLVTQPDREASGSFYRPESWQRSPGPLPAITEVVAHKPPDRFDGRVAAACWEPLFRYDMRLRLRRPTPGSPFRVARPAGEADAAPVLNFHNPACLVYGEENDCSPWDFVRLDERERLERLLRNEDPGWRVPAAQRVANAVSLLALVGAALVLAWPLVRRR